MYNLNLPQDHLSHFSQGARITIFKAIYLRLPDKLFSNRL